MQFKKWVVNPHDKELCQTISEECGISPFIALVSLGRGHTDYTELEQFLSEEIIIGDPYELTDMEKAVEVISDAIYDNKTIAVFGDYDVDGITATALVYSYLKNRGANVVYHIPDRIKEGYGMNINAIDKLKSQNVDLIITVDNGIASRYEVEYAKSLGMKVVVTDHHLPSGEIPDADAVIDPHRADDYSEFKEICGVFVAFKLVCALEGKSPEELLYEYGDLVAIGTIADIMPLISENRSAVKCGLNLIAEGRRMGISALLSQAGSDEYLITASKVAFILAPRLNAAGRMGDAARGLELLLTDDDEAAVGLSAIINNENSKRQSIEKNILLEAFELIEKRGYKYDRVIVVSGENWHSGVTGIVAARIVEKYGKPAIVLSDEDGIANGSARSVSGFSIYNAICSASYILSKYGGHEMAAGVTLPSSNIDDFRRAVNEYAREQERVFAKLQLDCKINPRALDISLVYELKELEPFGAGNPTPLFGIFDVTLKRITPVGQGKHLRLEFVRDDTIFSAMLFGTTKAAFPYDADQKLDLAVTLDISNYSGEPTLTVNIKDIRLSNINEQKFFEDINIYEDFKNGIKRDYSSILPERAEVADIYKTVLNNSISIDKLVINKLNSIGYAKTLVSAQALCELKILTYYDVEGIAFLKPNDTANKVNLEDSSIFKRLRGEELGI